MLATTKQNANFFVCNQRFNIFPTTTAGILPDTGRLVQCLIKIYRMNFTLLQKKKGRRYKIGRRAAPKAKYLWT